MIRILKALFKPAIYDNDDIENNYELYVKMRQGSVKVKNQKSLHEFVKEI